MTDRKTCGTCGPDGGRCEWYYRNPPLCWRCKNKRKWDTGECGQHAVYREQRERVAELEEELASAIAALSVIYRRADNVDAVIWEETIYGIKLIASKYKVQP